MSGVTALTCTCDVCHLAVRVRFRRHAVQGLCADQQREQKYRSMFSSAMHAMFDVKSPDPDSRHLQGFGERTLGLSVHPYLCVTGDIIIAGDTGKEQLREPRASAASDVELHRRLCWGRGRRTVVISKSTQSCRLYAGTPSHHTFHIVSQERVSADNRDNAVFVQHSHHQHSASIIEGAAAADLLAQRLSQR
jgi:hypothetical protein